MVPAELGSISLNLMPYVTVFEITQKPFQWWFPAFGLMFVVVGILLILIGRKRTSQERVRIGFTLHSRKKYLATLCSLSLRSGC